MRTEGSTEHPYRENPPEHSKEVHWGWLGGQFVVGAARYSDIDTAIRYLVMRKKDDIPKWENLGVAAFGPSGEVMGGTFGGTAFVLVGAAHSFSTHSYGLIMASRDGHTWEQVYTGANPDDSESLTGSSVFGVVWDGSKFWAGAHESNNPGRDVESYEVDILLTSDDGFRWAEAGRRVIPFLEWPEGYPTGMLVAHCSDKVKDTNGNAVPDGIYGKKDTLLKGKKDTLLIRPSTIQRIDYLFGISGSNVSFETTVLLNDRPIDVGIPVASVANAGDVWVAGGGRMADGESSRSAYSVDAGETWTKIDTPGVSAVMCSVVGRPL